MAMHMSSSFDKRIANLCMQTSALYLSCWQIYIVAWSSIGSLYLVHTLTNTVTNLQKYTGPTNYQHDQFIHTEHSISLMHCLWYGDRSLPRAGFIRCFNRYIPVLIGSLHCNRSRLSQIWMKINSRSRHYQVDKFKILKFILALILSCADLCVNFHF